MEENTLKTKEALLRQNIAGTGSAVVAFSGGVDSTLLSFVTHQELGDKMIAVVGVSPSLPLSQQQKAEEFAREHGLPLRLVETNELDNPQYAENSPKRCYFCKHTLFSALMAVAREHGISTIFDGSNVDDLGDYRPGMAAVKEFSVVSPLAEAGFTKEEIRALSKKMDLPTWDMPAFACLSSRFPYGEKITEEKLRQVGRAEEALRELGFRQFRVRHHGSVARVEIAPDEMPKALEQSVLTAISSALKQTGYTFVSLDMDGYRTGSMNSLLSLKP